MTRPDDGPSGAVRSVHHRPQLGHAAAAERRARVAAARRADSGGHELARSRPRIARRHLPQRRQDREAPLKPGDRIRIGDTELRIETGESSALTSGHFDFRQVNALLAGLRALGSGQVLDEVLAIVLDSTLEADRRRARVHPAGRTGRTARAASRARQRGGITLSSAHTSKRIPDEVFATGVDRIVSDLLDDANAARHGGTLALGIRHVLCTPLKVPQFGGESHSEAGERRIGVLYLDSREKGYLQTAGVLHALAAEAAVVIENARMYQEAVQPSAPRRNCGSPPTSSGPSCRPTISPSPAVDLAASTTPCRSVGGDLFDYVPHDEGRLSFTVADVAGKGTSAALLTAVVQGLLAGESTANDSPAQVCSRLNRSLCRRAVASRFVTVFYGQLGHRSAAPLLQRRAQRAVPRDGPGHPPPRDRRNGRRAVRLQPLRHRARSGSAPATCSSCSATA